MCFFVTQLNRIKKIVLVENFKEASSILVQVVILKLQYLVLTSLSYFGCRACRNVNESPRLASG